jgi:nitrate reductase NapAB chaperone NapD
LINTDGAAQQHSRMTSIKVAGAGLPQHGRVQGTTNTAAAAGRVILGAVVRTRPAHLAAVCERLNACPGTEVALNPGDGRLVVLLEDGDGASAERTLGEVSRWSEVLSATLVYEHTEPELQASKEPAHAS